ncbi:MAG: M56 family metallopeptidase [Planctomycetota bacterium]
MMFTLMQSLSRLSRQFSMGSFAVQSTIPVVIAFCLMLFLRQRSAAIRHRVWLLGLLATLITSLTWVVFPKVSIGILPQSLVWSGVVANSAIPKPADGLTGSSEAPVSDSNPLAVGESTDSPSMRTEPSSTMRSDGHSPPTLGDWHEVLVLGWLVGLTLGALMFLLAVLWQWTRVRSLSKIDDPEWLASVDEASRQLGLQFTVESLASSESQVPATVGFFWPKLIVPLDWSSWSLEQRRCILLHELAHVQRYDVASQLLARVVLLIHWFNPLIWYATAQLRAEREVASDDCVLNTGQTASSYAQQLLSTVTRYRTATLITPVAMAHTNRIDDRVRMILDPEQDRKPMGLRFSFVSLVLASVLSFGLGMFTLTPSALADETGLPDSKTPVWRENYTVEYPGALPVSVAFSSDGSKLLTGDTTGEIMALLLEAENPTYAWKTQVGGSHPAVAYSPDGGTAYCTTTNGVVILGAEKGDEKARIVEENSQPICVDVFPDKEINATTSFHQIVFGNSRGYFVRTWANSIPPENAGTISTSTLSEGREPGDLMAAPIAVDPRGRSAIMTGPIDGTGQVAGKAGRNVLWAYVCGDYDEGSPGNRVMKGHASQVVAAAWSKSGSIAVTGDASGRIIEWKAADMKESTRRELNGRVGALAISDDGRHIAAYVLGKTSRVVVWNSSEADAELQTIHVDSDDLSGPNVFASLDFSADGNRLAACAGNKSWLQEDPQWVGKVHLWNFSQSPSQQPAPKLAFETAKRKAQSNIVIPNNHAMYVSASEEGAVDSYDVDDGKILMRMVIGEMPIRRIELSSDRKWMAIEQLTSSNDEVDVQVMHANFHPRRATISACQKLLGLSKHGTHVAVIRNNKIELWDTVNSKLVQSASFLYRQVDASKFSPDGQLLAIADQRKLHLWQWKENAHEEISLEAPLSALAFSPGGEFIAEGPSDGNTVNIRDVQSRSVVRSLEAPRGIKAAGLRFTQGGRVLIGADSKEREASSSNAMTEPRIFLWDVASGELAHQLEIAGLPRSFDVSPNELYLVSQVEDKDGVRLAGWRLDGKEVTVNSGRNDRPAADTKD